MTIKKSFAITLLSIGLAFSTQVGASSLGPVIAQAYEIQLSNFRAPATANGGVSFQECEECTRMSVRVTSGTLYKVNGKAVKLEDFRKAIAYVSDRDEVVLTVLHHLESDTIEMIDVSL
jgi:hypothetical protein